jgi:sortase (surface protein transpeptidase)
VTVTPTGEATVSPPTQTSEVTVTPTGEATVSPPTPTSEVTVTPTGEATVSPPTPTSEATMTPTGEATVSPPTPTSEASPTPTDEAMPTPTSEATAAPTSAPTTAPTSAPTTAPTSEVSPTPSAPSVVGLPVTGGVATLQDEGHSALRLSSGVPVSAQPLISEPFIDPSLDLRASPVEVPLELRIPSLGISAPVLAVGLTPKNVMDAPQGSADDPVWQQAFWYRGGGIPGEPGTATIAGHVDGIRGRPALLARLKDLRPGDLIIVHNTWSGLDVRFLITEMATYSTDQAADPSVLARIYGRGPVLGTGPQPAPDGLSHLTLITCSGSIVQGAYDHRLVVYAQRDEV